MLEIIEGIRDFLGNAAPGEEVFFYYSGHGLTNKADEKGETLLPADTQMKLTEVAKDGSESSYRETGHILGRELRSLVAELEEKGIRLKEIGQALIVLICPVRCNPISLGALPNIRFCVIWH